MNHKTCLLFCIGLALHSMGCMEIRAVDKKKKEVAAPMSSTLLAESIGEWNQYQVVIPVPMGSVVRRARMDLKSRAFTTPDFVSTQIHPGGLSDTNVEPGATYKYEWGYMQGTDYVPQGVEVIAVPLDLELSGEVDLTDFQGLDLRGVSRFGRLWFQPGTIVTTNGHSWTVRADEVMFRGARVQSFPKGAKSKVGMRGRHGGRIHFSAGKATGELFAELRGEHGGDGAPGADPGLELKGRDGRDGRFPRLTFVGYCNEFSSCKRYRCEGEVSNGENGERGLKGHRGGDGQPGGDSAELVVDVFDRTRLRIETVFEVGEGGQAGAPGLGGKGGKGGAAFEGRAPKEPGMTTLLEGYCPTAKPGMDGAQGEMGEPGRAGERGRKQPVCYLDPGKDPACGA